MGRRLFHRLEDCVSRYYDMDIKVGERLVHHVPPTSHPVELYRQRLRAIRQYIPEPNSGRFSCFVGDEFLLVHEDDESELILVTCVKTRHSGYLPRLCVKKEYPAFISKFDYFYPDDSQQNLNVLLADAGPYSYLIRPCGSLPGFYTLLLYDGERIRKFRIELASRQSTPTNVSFQPPSPEKHRRFSDPVPWSSDNTSITSSPDSNPALVDSSVNIDRAESEHTVGCQNGRSRKSSFKNNTSSIDGLGGDGQQQSNHSTGGDRYFKYSGILFPTIESIVAVIEMHSGLTASQRKLTVDNDTTDKVVPVSDTDQQLAVAIDEMQSSTHTLQDSSQPIPASDLGYLELTGADGDCDHHHQADSELLSLINTKAPALPTIFKPVRKTPTSQADSKPPSSDFYMRLRSTMPWPLKQNVVEIHGELMMMTNAKKWKHRYARVDDSRHELILTDLSSRVKPDLVLPLTRFKFFPLHPYSHDRDYCFGLTGRLSGSSSSIWTGIFSVPPPPSIGGGASGGDPLAQAWSTTYAGHRESQRHHHPGGDPNTLGMAPTSDPVDGDTNRLPSPPPPPSNQTVFYRWIRSIRRHCFNTRPDALNEEDMQRRRSKMRCYRTLEIKLENARLMSRCEAKQKREEPAYFVLVNGIEIARAYSGNLDAELVFDDFPFGLDELEIFAKGENRRKRCLLVERRLFQRNINDVGQRSCKTECDSASTTNTTPICRVQGHVGIRCSFEYRELHVLPFCHYKDFRQAIRDNLVSEVVPLAIYIWRSLPKGSEQLGFVSSLLLAAVELKCHLELIFEVLKGDVKPENGTAVFRQTTLGTQMLELYSNWMCSKWRQTALSRVRDQAEMFASPESSFCRRPSSGTFDEPPLPPRMSSIELSDKACRSNPSIQSGGSSNDQYPPTSTVSLPPPTIVNAFQQLQPFQQPTSPPCDSLNQLIATAIDDLVKHVDQFPLQVRWIYAKLQTLCMPSMRHAVGSNLVLLRSICANLTAPSTVVPERTFLSTITCPQIYPGPLMLASATSSQLGCSDSSSSIGSGGGNRQSDSSLAGSSPSRPEYPLLVSLAKALLTLGSATPSEKSITSLSKTQFDALRSRLLNDFLLPITSPLSPNDLDELQSSANSESIQANYLPLSRELAQLARRFSTVCLVDGTSTSAPAGCVLPMTTNNQPGPNCPKLATALVDLQSRIESFNSTPASSLNNESSWSCQYCIEET